METNTLLQIELTGVNIHVWISARTSMLRRLFTPICECWRQKTTSKSSAKGGASVSCNVLGSAWEHLLTIESDVPKLLRYEICSKPLNTELF